MNIELVVFDMAGTTVDDAGAVHLALQKALLDHGVDADYDEVNEVMGYPKPIAIEKLLKAKAPEKCTAENIDRIHESFVSGMVDHYAIDPGVTEKPTTSDTFRRLKEMQVKVAIDTGFSRPIAQTIIDRLGWEKNNLIDFVVTSDEVENGRPFPDMIYRAMEATGVQDHNKVAKVGDTLSDLQQGNAAGVKYVIGVTTGAYNAAQLQVEKHTHLIGKLDELIPIIEG